ncbi:TonB-dependent receptor domain-containing protein [Rouxiella sp. Mn2063]|uniref:TonB-dependent receptor domain-containing protein n=1 Tax=Rouxiella sp. Mn2063 TaxID=3395262 RepID=UPI003BC10597
MFILKQGKRHANSLFLLSLLSSAITSAVAADNTAVTTTPGNQTHTAANSDDNKDVMTVVAPKQVKKAGTSTQITASDMQRNGGNDFGSIMRYQPLISATGSSPGSSVGKSGFDRSGYTGYNIRGMESNRIGLDVDGIPLPNATGRSYVSRAGLNTFGIGRDYIDPYMYGLINIESGTTAADNANSAIGGSVSFEPKSPDQYLNPNKHTYFGYQSDFDSSDHSWHNGITAAGGDQTLRGIVVISRRDGQQTRNNSDSLKAYPMNWHSTALMTSGIWQPNDEHKFTATADVYDKTSHSHYDAWNDQGSSILGTAQQKSDTKRWSFSLSDAWTPNNIDWLDEVDTKLYYQNAEAQDDTYMPNDPPTSMQTVGSGYNVKTYGFETKAMKEVGIHRLSAGINAKQSDTERPFTQDPAPSIYTVIMQPEANSKSYTLGGFVQDDMTFDLGGHAFSIVPAVRAIYQNTKPTDLGDLSAGSAVLNEASVETLYGKTNSDTKVLPSLSFLYDITPKLTAYLQYKRGAEFPDASQLYGSWNLGSSYAGTQQYALIGNTNLQTETSNAFELGLKGEAVEGVTFSGSVFYTAYQNFIAYTRYTRSGSPQMFANVPGNIYTIYQAENRDKAYIYGGEMSAKVNYGTWFKQVDGLSTSFALGYNQGKSKSSYLGDKYIDLDSVAPMKAVIGVAWDAPSKRYGAAVISTFVKGKQQQATNRQSYSNTGAPIANSTTSYDRIPGYGLVDLTAYVRVTPTVKISGGIYNVMDKKYWDYLSSRDLTNVTNQDAYNQALATEPGRTFQLGVNVDF